MDRSQEKERLQKASKVCTKATVPFGMIQKKGKKKKRAAAIKRIGATKAVQRLNASVGIKKTIFTRSQGRDSGHYLFCKAHFYRVLTIVKKPVCGTGCRVYFHFVTHPKVRSEHFGKMLFV